MRLGSSLGSVAYGVLMSTGASDSKTGSSRGWFPLTRWSLVAQAGGAADACEPVILEAARREALDTLLQRYLPALRSHLLSRSARLQDVDEILQEFITERVLERDLLAHADRERGRFRTFLVTSLNNFCANRHRFHNARRRAPKGMKILSLAGSAEDGDAGGAPEGPAIDVPDRKGDSEQPTDVFDIAWAKQVLAEALRRMRIGCVGCGATDLWEIFELRVLRPALEDADPLSYAEMVNRFGYATPKQAANVLVTAKRRFEAALRSVLAEYVNDEEELAREQMSLGAILGSSRARLQGAKEAGGGGRELRQSAGTARSNDDIQTG